MTPRASSSARKRSASPGLIGLDVAIVVADDWAEGMAASLRRGVAWASAAGHDAIAMFTCDQPRLSLDHATALVATFRASLSDPGTTISPERSMIIASRYADTLGVPAVFGRDRYPDLLAQRGDRGARALLRGDRDVIAVDWPDGAFDIDTPADAATYQTE